jgi:ubiquinone/menaquinone biosynthesis C-methylase UbiE
MIKRICKKMCSLPKAVSNTNSGAASAGEVQQRKVSFENAIPLEVTVTPDTIHNFTYSTVRNAVAFSCLRSPDFYGYSFDIYQSAIKCYQDLLVLSFIRDSLPPGSRILDVGGANSRVLTHLSNEYECWCIDKYEGLGQGDVVVPGSDSGFKVVVDYMGNFNSDLPDTYFDMVFSVSALEHGLQEKKVIQNILLDIDRVLKTGGFSLHCIDAVIDKTNGTGGKLVNDEFFKVARNKLPAWSDIIADKDLYVLPENIFDIWNMGRPYSDICIIDTCAFWVKE